MPDPIRRRDDEDTERELRVDRSNDEGPPGGAEGGEASPAADVVPGLPADDESPLGDVDQHSDAENLPPHRDEHNQHRDERNRERSGS